MPKCTRKGCSKEYEEANNAEGSCTYHPGGPVFHEGLKSWSCCSEVNKPVLEFDQFMAIPPCTTGSHTSEAPAAPAPSSASTSTPVATYTDENGKEVYGVKPKPPTATATDAIAPAITPAGPSKSSTPSPAQAPVEPEEDDLSVPVPEGTACKRLGCGARWAGEEVSRGASGEGAKCRHHPQPAIFHEGSKGYLCCKRRVLEFSEFLKIEGCTEGNHLFVGSKKDGVSDEEIVNCRIDHYQTPTTVHVSAFAKNADKSRSTVTFTSDTLSLSLFLPQNKRVERTITLYGPIDPEKSAYRILGTKIDITLVKPSPSSWSLLELPPPGSELPPGYALTFGVSGRTGTVGGKEIVLAPEEMAKRGA